MSSLDLIFSDSRNVSKFLARGDPLEALAAELGPKFLDYRRRWELARTFQEIPPFPLHVDYELLSDCNLRCPMCPMSSRGRPLGVSQKLNLTKVKELIDEGTERGQASIGFGGLWEPLLSKDLPEIIAYGREKGIIEAMFNTNGLLLDEERAKSLIKSGLTRIMISLDAVSPETYRQMRPGSDLRQVEENIRSFIKIRHEARSRLPLVRLSFCLTKINSSELIPFLERWEETVDFFSLQSYGRFDDKAPLLFPETTMTNTGLLESPSGKCAQPFKRLLVRHNGQVLPCCDLSGLDLSLGTAEQGLSSLWAGSDLGQLRTKLLTASFSKLPESCQKCQTKYQPPLGEIPLPY